MFVIKTEQELLNAFRPKDRTVVELAPEVKVPLGVRDYVAWVEPAGTRTFLVLQDPSTQRPLGIAFTRDSAALTDGRGPLMCDWCHSSGSRLEVGMLSARVNSKRNVGVILCRDLRCAQKLEEAADLAGRSSVIPRQRLLERMHRFVREGLGIDAVPAA